MSAIIAWFKINKWAQWLAIGLMAFAGYKTWKWNVERGVKRQMREKQEREAAEAVAEVVTNITRNTDEIVQHADTVRSAPAVVELPDGTKTLPDYHFRD